MQKLREYPKDALNLIQDANAPNEEILEAAERIDGVSLAPEVSSRTADITVYPKG